MSGCMYYFDDRTALTMVGVTIILVIAFITFYILDYIKEISKALDHKIDVILKKVDMFANIIGIVTEGAQEIIHTEISKRTQKDAPVDNLDVQEIRAVDETQEEDSASRPSGLAVPIEEVEATFETPEELK